MQPGLDRDLIGLGTWSMGGGAVRVILLAGVDYREHLIPQLESWGCDVDVPMQGLSFGEQKRWLMRQTDELTSQRC